MAAYYIFFIRIQFNNLKKTDYREQTLGELLKKLYTLKNEVVVLEPI